MSTRIAVCPGTFDPVTLGHLDIVRRALNLVDEVIIGIGINPSKRTLLDPDQRRDLAEAAVAGIPGVRVELVPGLLVDFCTDVGASVIVKGLRGGADYDAEHPMTLMNRHLSGIDTFFVPADPTLAHISSSLVRDVARFGGDISDLVPAPVVAALAAALARE